MQKMTLFRGQRGLGSVCALINFLSSIGNFHDFAFGLKQPEEGQLGIPFTQNNL